MAELSIRDIMEIVTAENEKAMGFPEDPAKGLAELTPDEVRAINTRIAEIAENEDVFESLWQSRFAIYDAVRAVKKENPGTTFIGFGAGGDNEIDIVRIRPQDVVRGGTALTDWLTSVTATGVADYESGSGGDYVALGEGESRVYCGWVNPIASPKAVGVLIDHVGEQKKYRVDLLWSLNRDFPIVVHKPVLLRPNTRYKIQVRYNATGDDALQPVGVVVKIASQITF